VTIVGGIGTDDLGNIALRSLSKAGVNIEHVARRSDWKTGCAAIRSMGKSKSILTAGGIVDPTVVFDSLQTLGFQRGDHLHFSWAPSHAMHDQLQHWRQMGISLSRRIQRANSTGTSSAGAAGHCAYLKPGTG